MNMLPEEGIIERNGVMCGIVDNGFHGKEIIVAGGYGEDPDEHTKVGYLNHVEILSLKTMQWRSGSNKKLLYVVQVLGSV